MAKHKRREQEPIRNETNNSNNNTNNSSNNNNNPFGIDPGQLMGLLGGNFDMNSMGNILASMNTNGFNLGSLAPLAKMAGINLGNNFPQGNNINSGMNGNMNNGMNGNMNYNMNNGMNGNSNINTDTPINSSPSEKANSNNHRKSSSKGSNNKNDRGYDENLDFLISLKSYVHPDRIKFIDKIIELYNSGIFEDI